MGRFPGRGTHALQHDPIRPFFILLLPAYWVLPRRVQTVLLLAASYYFYAQWDAQFLALLATSTVVDYACALAVDRIEAPGRRKVFVALSLALTLGFLGLFKYYNFFAQGLRAALAQVGWSVASAHLEVILPIGISFYNSSR